MEYVPGSSMWGQIENFGAYGEQVLKKFAFQLFTALAYMHGKRIMHRDIKARNLLINPKGDLKLCDFGSARHFVPVCIHI
jgi:serine/threonine protein kinase